MLMGTQLGDHLGAFGGGGVVLSAGVSERGGGIVTWKGVGKGGKVWGVWEGGAVWRQGGMTGGS